MNNHIGIDEAINEIDELRRENWRLKHIERHYDDAIEALPDTVGNPELDTVAQRIAILVIDSRLRIDELERDLRTARSALSTADKNWEAVRQERDAALQVLSGATPRLEANVQSEQLESVIQGLAAQHTELLTALSALVKAVAPDEVAQTVPLGTGKERQ